MMVTICYSIWLSSAASNLDSDTTVAESDQNLSYHYKCKAETVMKLGSF